ESFGACRLEVSACCPEGAAARAGKSIIDAGVWRRLEMWGSKNNGTRGPELHELTAGPDPLDKELERSGKGKLGAAIMIQPHVESIGEVTVLGVPVERTRSPKPKPTTGERLGFGRLFTDHMLLAEHEEGRGWGGSRIVPVGSSQTDIASAALQY